MPSSSNSSTEPPAQADKPSVERTLFSDQDVLQAETALHVAADHGLGVSRAAGAEARRAAALQAEMERLQLSYDAATAPDERTRRRLTRAALATRRVPVPGWALQGGQYWPMSPADINQRRVVQMLSLRLSPVDLPSAALTAAKVVAADAASLPPRPPRSDGQATCSSHPAPAVVPAVARVPSTPVGLSFSVPPRPSASPAASLDSSDVGGLWDTDSALRREPPPVAAPPPAPSVDARAPAPPEPVRALRVIGGGLPGLPSGAQTHVPSTLGASSPTSSVLPVASPPAWSPDGHVHGGPRPSAVAGHAAVHLPSPSGHSHPYGGAPHAGAPCGGAPYGAAAPWGGGSHGGAIPWPSTSWAGHAPLRAVGGGDHHWGGGPGWAPWGGAGGVGLKGTWPVPAPPAPDAGSRSVSHTSVSAPA